MLSKQKIKVRLLMVNVIFVLLLIYTYKSASKINFWPSMQWLDTRMKHFGSVASFLCCNFNLDLRELLYSTLVTKYFSQIEIGCINSFGEEVV